MSTMDQAAANHIPEVDFASANPARRANRADREWVLPRVDPALAGAIGEALGCPDAIGHLLAARGLTVDRLSRFLLPTLDDLHPPGLMKGLDDAVRRIQLAVEAREPILVYGDYDVDGTTATVLLKTAIDRVSPPNLPSLVSWHVPHRIREGYGMQGSRLAEAAQAGIRLVISVDTGVRAFAAAEEARALGLDLIVTDHHLPDRSQGVPAALAVINPAQTDCAYPFKDLCGAAIAFKLAHGILEAKALEAESSHAALRFLRERLLPSLLKLVAIATIADSVPLVGENRVLVALGLRELANPVQPGLRALMEVAALPLDRSPSVTDVGFRLGPRINAAGRMDVADDVVELFLTRSPGTAVKLANKLNDLNETRRATEREALATIEEQLLALLDGQGQFPAECLVLDHAAWHRGVLGILASRVVERTGRPALVLTNDGEHAHGSGRSIAGFHLLDALTAAHEMEGVAPNTGDEPYAPLLTRFGGHAHAVGLTLASTKLATLRSRMRHVSRDRGLSDVPAPLRCDAELTARDLTSELAGWIERCAPFGAGFHEPLFLVRSLRLCAPVRVIKERHICLSLESAAGQLPLQAIGWSRAVDWIAVAAGLKLGTGSQIDVAGRLCRKQNQWFNGLELEIHDLRQS